MAIIRYSNQLLVSKSKVCRCSMLWFVDTLPGGTISSDIPFEGPRDSKNSKPPT